MLAVQKKKVILASILLIIGIVPVRQLYLRLVYDIKNNKVEVCIELEQLKKFCKKENYKLQNLLERIKTIGVSSLVLQEETFESLCNSGKIMYFTHTDVKKFHLFGLLAPGAELKEEMIVVEDKRIATYIKSIVKEKTGITLYEKKSGNYRLFEIPETLKTLGFGYLPEDITLVQKNTFSLILKPYNEFWIPLVLPDNLSCIKLQGKRYVNKTEINRIATENIKVGIEEFSDEEKLYRHLFIPIAENILRMHRIHPAASFVIASSPEATEASSSLRRYWVNKLIRRWIRAVKERNCRIIYFDFLDKLNIEENLSYLRDLCNQLRKCKFELTNIGSQKKISGLPVWLANFVAFIVAVISPLLSVYYLKKATRKHSTSLQEESSTQVSFEHPNRLQYAKLRDIFKKFFQVSLINFIAGLAISAILTSSVFLVKIAEFRSVRVAFILPVVLSVFVLFDMNKLKEFFLKPQSLFNTSLIFILVFTLFAAVYRIGTIERISTLELWLRESFEEMFYIRPRFKEFLIGHPLMILGLSLNNKLLLIFGLIGQLSLINTFIHVHIPLSISILRTIYGIFLGSLIGLIVLYFRRFYYKIW
ncbi:MAG: DUF5693 family protein [Elusimicrobiota bacterium]|nr:DUF5693 family protein [Elusimicrobiota bacterium]